MSVGIAGQSTLGFRRKLCCAQVWECYALCCAESDNREHCIGSQDDVCWAPGPPQREKGTCPNTQRVTVKEKGSDKPTGRSASIRRRLNKCGPPFGGHGQSHFLFFVLCQSSLNRFCVDIWKENIWIYLHLCWMVTSEEWTIDWYLDC